MPSTTAYLKEGEMATERCSQADSVRVLLELLVGYGLLHCDLCIVNDITPPPPPQYADTCRGLTGSSAAWIAR